MYVHSTHTQSPETCTYLRDFRYFFVVLFISLQTDFDGDSPRHARYDVPRQGARTQRVAPQNSTFEQRNMLIFSKPTYDIVMRCKTADWRPRETPSLSTIANRSCLSLWRVTTKCQIPKNKYVINYNTRTYSDSSVKRIAMYTNTSDCEFHGATSPMSRAHIMCEGIPICLRWSQTASGLRENSAHPPSDAHRLLISSAWRGTHRYNNIFTRFYEPV